jgi:hypothetical protein
MGEGVAEAKLMVALVDLVATELCPQGRQDRRVHYCFNYSQEGRTDLAGAPSVGAHPRGMSGGAVFAVGHAKTSTGSYYVPFLVGILTEFHEDSGMLVASRVRNVWEALGILQAGRGGLFRATGA